MMTGVSDGQMVPDDVRLSGEILLGLSQAFDRRPLPPPPPSAFQPLSRFGMGLGLGFLDRGREQTRRRSVSIEGTEDELEVRLILQPRLVHTFSRSEETHIFSVAVPSFSSSLSPGRFTVQLLPFSWSSYSSFSSTSTSISARRVDRNGRPESATISQRILPACFLLPPPSSAIQWDLSTSKILQYLVVELGSYPRQALLGWKRVEERRRRRSCDDACYGEGGCGSWRSGMGGETILV